MEFAHLVYRKSRTYEDYVGLRGLKRYGKKKWRRYVVDIVTALKHALQADYVVLGGGNVKKLKSCRKAFASATTTMSSPAAFAYGKRPGRMSALPASCGEAAREKNAGRDQRRGRDLDLPVLTLGDEIVLRRAHTKGRLRRQP